MFGVEVGAHPMIGMSYFGPVEKAACLFWSTTRCLPVSAWDWTVHPLLPNSRCNLKNSSLGWLDLIDKGKLFFLMMIWPGWWWYLSCCYGEASAPRELVDNSWLDWNVSFSSEELLLSRYHKLDISHISRLFISNTSQFWMKKSWRNHLGSQS